MKINDIYTAYVSWTQGGKRRPVLIIQENNTDVLVFKITSKYKSSHVQKYYYPLIDWKISGLVKPSYVDTMSRVRLLKDEVSFHYVGRLSVRDRIGLAEFIENNML